MIHFLITKLLHLITVLIGVTLITFLLMQAIPGNPLSNYSSQARVLFNQNVDKGVQRAIFRHYGLDLPLWRQFTRYMIGDLDENGSFTCGAVCGNLGPSIQQRGRTVQDILFNPPRGQRFWKSPFGYSIRLVLLGSLIAAGIGIPLGILITAKKKSRLSRTISFSLAALNSIPNFVFGLLAIIVLASGLRIMKVLPDWNNPGSWIIPAYILAVAPMASIARITHISLVNLLSEDFIRTARAKGLTQRRVMLVHVLRNAWVPIITYLGPTLIELFAGLFIVENLYSFPGFGRQYWLSVLALDYPMIMGLTLLYATGMVLTNTLIEILCMLLDPRIRTARQQGAP